MSWTLGPRGTSVGIGKRGARLNTSFMGFSSSQNLYKPPPKQKHSITRQPTSPIRHVSLPCGVTDAGLLTFQQHDANERKAATEELAQKQNPKANRGLIQRDRNRGGEGKQVSRK